MVDRIRRALLYTMLVVAAGFVVVLRIGFALAGTPLPAEFPDALVAPAALVLIVAGIWLAVRAWRATAHWRILRTPEPTISAPPPDVPVLVDAAAATTDDDAAESVTCRHLQAVERGVRNSGIAVHDRGRQRAQADCRIDVAGMQERFGVEALALYKERHEIDRSYLDPKTARFECPACRSALQLVHPDEAGVSTPWFPPRARA